jgi:hypothetical protein
MVSAFFSSVRQGLSEGKTVRQWRKTKSFEELQAAFYTLDFAPRGRCKVLNALARGYKGLEHRPLREWDA